MQSSNDASGSISRWNNRIVGHDVKPASWFLASESNWRIHPRLQQEALLGLLDSVGWVQDVIVNRRTDESWGVNQHVETMIDGHLRVMLALREGDEVAIPLTYIDLAPQEEALVLATLDPISAMAVADKERLDGLLREVETGDPALQEMLADLAKRHGIVPPSLGPELDESLADGISLCICPTCGHEHAKAKEDADG